jgi:hypothetical protein
MNFSFIILIFFSFSVIWIKRLIEGMWYIYIESTQGRVDKFLNNLFESEKETF